MNAKSLDSIKSDDIILWPDGEWCYRHQIHEFQHKSDDYKEINGSTSTGIWLLPGHSDTQ